MLQGEKGFEMTKNSGRYPWKSDGDRQRIIGTIVNVARRIYTAHPDTKDDLKLIIDSYGDLYDAIEDHTENDEPLTMSGIMIDRIFKS